ncbi:MAG: hypothetical protein ACD_75C01777G0003 [uncultured bacterium]|nr:MAG: hypothetical protein ACD_75C01777G0003 [uncultured bacterium]
MSKAGRLGWKDILNHQKFHRIEGLPNMDQIGVGLGRILAQDKYPLELAANTLVEHLHRF